MLMESQKQMLIEAASKRPLGGILSYKGMGTIIHIVSWCIVFGIPFFFTGRESESVTIQSYMRFVLVPLSFMFVFYVNYFLLVPQTLFKKRTIHFFLSNVVLIIFTMVAIHFLMRILPPEAPLHARPHRTPPLREIIGFFSGNAMLYLLVAALSVAIRMTNSWFEMESIRREVEQKRTEAELKNLKNQLNPHFLFNTLNNIYCLIAFSPERAQGAVHDLSRLLRYVLYESSQELVPLEKDLDFIRNYVELMRIRLPENVTTDMEINVNQGIQIAPLLFISPIENAFKHGISNNRPSFIRISIRQEGGQLCCRIVNSYFPKDATQDKSGSGIGIQNLERRLELLYPEHYSLIHEQQGDKYVCELKLDLS